MEAGKGGAKGTKGGGKGVDSVGQRRQRWVQRELTSEEITDRDRRNEEVRARKLAAEAATPHEILSDEGEITEVLMNAAEFHAWKTDSPDLYSTLQRRKAADVVSGLNQEVHFTRRACSSYPTLCGCR